MATPLESDVLAKLSELLSPPTWTFATLKEYLEGQISEVSRQAKEGDAQLTTIANERNNRYDERARNAETALTAGFAAQQAALTNAFTAANQANVAAADSHKDVHSANATALELANKEMKEKLLEMNNLRQQITGERATYITRDVLDARLAALETQNATHTSANADRIANLEKARSTTDGVGAGQERAQSNQHTSNIFAVSVFAAIVAAGGLVAFIEVATRAH
jgi:hypothetical protein